MWNYLFIFILLKFTVLKGEKFKNICLVIHLKIIITNSVHVSINNILIMKNNSIFQKKKLSEKDGLVLHFGKSP